MQEIILNPACIGSINKKVSRLHLLANSGKTSFFLIEIQD